MTDIKSDDDSVKRLESPKIPIIPFAVPLPKSGLLGPDELLIGNDGIVGTITVLKNSVIVWVGWGKLVDSSNDGSSEYEFGKGRPEQGHMVVAMPRTNYKGAFGTGAKEASCSHIIGSANSDDQMLASQMASRLSTRSSMAVFVSCQLSSNSIAPEEWSEGLDSEMLSHLAAAAAEKEIWRILQDRQITEK